jgi:hypothetical protein
MAKKKKTLEQFKHPDFNRVPPEVFRDMMRVVLDKHNPKVKPHTIREIRSIITEYVERKNPLNIVARVIKEKDRHMNSNGKRRKLYEINIAAVRDLSDGELTYNNVRNHLFMLMDYYHRATHTHALHIEHGFEGCTDCHYSKRAMSFIDELYHHTQDSEKRFFG